MQRCVDETLGLPPALKARVCGARLDPKTPVFTAPKTCAPAASPDCANAAADPAGANSTNNTAASARSQPKRCGYCQLIVGHNYRTCPKRLRECCGSNEAPCSRPA
eukprot:2886840-Pleurochrysis_carterae.AAC.1